MLEAQALRQATSGIPSRKLTEKLRRYQELDPRGFRPILEVVYPKPKVNLEPRFVRYGTAGTHTEYEWEALKRRFNQRCAYCGIFGVPLTKDHVLAISQGGSDYIKNIVPACKPCNCRKHAKTLERFGLQPKIREVVREVVSVG